MAGDSRDLSSLSPEQKRALLAKLLKQKQAAAPHTDHRTSHGQRSLWFTQQLAPESTVYNISQAWILRGRLDTAALERAFQQMVDRHDVLRTSYVTRGEDLLQRVHARHEVRVEALEFAERSEPALRERLASLANLPFDLQRGPVIRAHLLRRGPDEHVLLFVIHHIACDMWSVELAVKELKTLYLAETGAEVDPLPPVRHQYVDFSRWQAEMLAGEAGERMWRYWEASLGGDHPVVEVPGDRPRPPVQRFAGAVHHFRIDPALFERLRRLAAEAQATPFALMLAAYQLLLSRYAQQERIPVGTPLLGRSRSEFEQIQGYFVNPVVLVGDLSGDPTFRELLARARQSALEALDNQDYPYEHLVERLAPRRDPSRLPLTDFYLVWDRPQTEGVEAEMVDGELRLRLDWGDLQLESVPMAEQGTPSDLNLLVLEFGNTLAVNLGYSTDLFERETIVRFADHLQRLLASIVEAPDRPVSELAMLSEAELSDLAIRADGTDGAGAAVGEGGWAPGAETLHGVFARRASETPDAVAVCCGDERLTYAELDARSDRVAARLGSLGVAPGQVVALCVGRSLELVVGLLGILKAGAAYLPLDPTNPAERLAFIFEDAGAAAVVTRGGEADGLSAGGRPVVDLADLASLPEAEPAAPPGAADDLAYIIYTSGSTGRPKGVEVTHRNVLALLEASEPYFGFGAEDVWTLFHSAAFDFSVWEFFGALLFGGRLVVVPFETSRDPAAFHGLLAREGVTVLNQTPSAFLPLVEADARSARLERLRWIVFGGEALDPASLLPWIDRYGDASPGLVNMYGITETTVHVTYRRIRRRDAEGAASSVIGRPLPHLHAYVLGPHGEPLPQGAVGELWIGGDGVARGYAQRPELTAERFVPDPFSGGGRLYRSGDLARRLADGSLEYCGRADQQVKIRGFRIELGEIDAALASHPDVRECATLAREDVPGDQRLVAYVVTSRRDAALREELLDLCRGRLPAYMVPAAVVDLDGFPLTGNGKLDRRALPAPEREGSEASVHEPPRNPLEKTLVALWGEMLRVERVGIRDDFFELGGHSILVTQMVERLRAEFGVEVPVAQFFQSPTVADLARDVAILKVSASAPDAGDSEREELVL